MSYCRYLYPLIRVEGISKNYVFCSCGVRQKNGTYSPSFIEDYGDKITNENLVDMIWKNLKDDEPFKEYIIKKLAERLKVKLRDKPLDERGFDIEWDKFSKRR